MEGRGRSVDRRRRVGPFAQTEVVHHLVTARPRTPEEEWRLIEIAALYRDGLPITHIANHLGVSRQRAQQLLDTAGVPRRRRPDERPQRGLNRVRQCQRRMARLSAPSENWTTCAA